MKIVILIHKGNGPESISSPHPYVNKVNFSIIIQRRRNKVAQPDRPRGPASIFQIHKLEPNQ